ncbi:MAG: PP2C family serine/threonine-protein phosphatase [Acholeplasmataceae bacterium]|nr:PP2C family serine/threonine-protein phosphatase [Acholeplasmataceae bacterium]
MIKFYGASVVGTSHLASETPCHDAHGIRILPNHLGYIACVSDGMGSAKAAEIGSEVASTFVLDYLYDYLDEKMTDDEVIDLIKDAYIKTHEKLKDEAVNRELTIKDLNATLLVFVSLGHRQFYGQVGDCSMIGKKDDTYTVLVEQQRGEYANATYSICDLISVENGIYKKLEDVYPMVALMSDGIESISISLRDKVVSHLFYDPFFNAFMHPNFQQEHVTDALKRFLSSERINKKTDDDKTLLFIYEEDV